MTTSRRPRRLARALVAGGIVVLGLAVWSPASAHVTIAEPEHEAGAYTLLTFGVPHGCEGSPTTELRIQMPESIPLVTPTVNPNWDVDKRMEELAEPIDAGHGEQLTERVSEVVYTAKTPLEDGYREAFVLSVQMPEDAAGETIYFPTIQTCETGETAWIEIPEAGDDPEALAAPAPSIEVVETSGESGDDTNETAPSTEATAAADDAVETGGGDAAAAAVAQSEADQSDDDSDSSDVLAIVALIVGAAGLGAGGLALAKGRRS